MQLVSRLIGLVFFSTTLKAQCQSVADVLSSKGNFSTLLQALQTSGLDKAAALTGDAEVTVFAPTDAAFNSLLKLLGASAEDLLARDDLSKILLLHVAVGKIDGSRIVPGAIVQSLEGARLFGSLTKSGDSEAVVVGNAKVIEADISAGKAIIHAIDTVLLPPERRLIEGGSSGWNESKWRVTVDGVMGGKSTGNVEFSNGHMVFTGDINLDGGGFSSVRRDYSVDLSSYAGLLVEFDAHAFTEGKAPLGVHLQLGDSTSSYDFSAAFAVPFSTASVPDDCKVFLPITAFTHASRSGRTCSSCTLNPATVDKLAVYVLFQSGPFEVKMYSIKAVKNSLDAPLPTTPSVALSSSAISSMIEASISSGGALWDKGYPELCIEIYATLLRQIVAAEGPSDAVRDLACAGLKMLSGASNNKKGWALRKAMDAIHSDLGSQDRKPDSSYPDYVQGSWLPAPGERGAEGVCAGVADFSIAGRDSTASASENPDGAAGNEESSSKDGSVAHFLGPFEGKGITGWNDLGSYENTSPEECAEKCLRNDDCRSFDYGARGSVKGECWLSTADREKAGNDYTDWNLYNYYERAPHEGKTTTPARPDAGGVAPPEATAAPPEATRETLVVDALRNRSGSPGWNNFTTLIKALNTTGLANAAVLSGAAEVTVFAPTDNAFSDLLRQLGASAEDLLARSDLSNILLLHVAAGQIKASRLAPGALVQTLEGARLFSATSEETGGVDIEGADVLKPDIYAGKALIHTIDKVLLPPQRHLVDGGSGGWEESKWSITVDGVMGGKSSGRTDFTSSSMVFAGNINLDGGGFSSVGRRYSMQMSKHAGFLIEFDSHVYKGSTAPLGVHLQLGDSSSTYDFSAAFAVPFSATAPARCRFFLPKKAFNYASRSGRTCSSCKFSGSVDSLAFYVLFQSGNFELRVHSIQAVKMPMDAPLPTAPSVSLSSSDVISLIRASIRSGAPLYDKGYHGLCIEIYSAAMRQVVAATGPSSAIRDIACAGLKMAMSGSDEKRAWALRKAMDAILADLSNSRREADSRYPSYVQGSWLPSPGYSGDEGVCAGVADLSGSGRDSTAGLETLGSIMEEPERMDPVLLDGNMQVDNFQGPFEGMGISGWNDLQHYKSKSREQCGKLCLADNRCRSFDYGARGKVLGECWLSTANRNSAPSAYTAWRLYDYYERTADSLGVADRLRGSATGSSAPSKDSDDDDDKEEQGPLMWILVGVGVLGGVILGLLVAWLVSRCRQRNRKLYGVKTGVELDANTVVVGQPVFGQPIDNETPEKKAAA